jgi:hypothetical protein
LLCRIKMVAPGVEAWPDIAGRCAQIFLRITELLMDSLLGTLAPAALQRARYLANVKAVEMWVTTLTPRLPARELSSQRRAQVFEFVGAPEGKRTLV